MLELLTVIILACQVGASGMGGNFTSSESVMNHQRAMVESNLKLQRACQAELINCVGTTDRGLALLLPKLRDCLAGKK